MSEAGCVAIGAACAGRVAAKAAYVTADTACPATPQPHGPSSGLHSSQAAQRRCPGHMHLEAAAAGALAGCRRAVLPARQRRGIRALELPLLKEELEAQMFGLFCTGQVKVTRSLLQRGISPRCLVPASAACATGLAASCPENGDGPVLQSFSPSGQH